MAKFEIKFEHSKKRELIAVVEAETKEEALELLEEDPYEYVEDQEGILIEGYDFKIKDTKEIEDK